MSTARRTHDVVATLGKYRTREGEEKKRYTNVGTAFTDDQGRVSIKLDTVPVGPEWSGCLSLYPIRDGAASPPTATERPRPPATSRPAPPEPEDDDIPFGT